MGLNEIIKIGDRIRKYRIKTLGITQAQMAEKLNIPRSTYANYENNTREPNLDTLNKIANIFDISVNELLGVEVKFSKLLLEKLESRLEILFNVDNIFDFLSKKLEIPIETLINVYKNNADCSLEDQVKLFKYLYKIDDKNFMKFCIQNEKYILKNKELSKIYSQAILNQGNKIMDVDKQNNKDLNKINDIFKYYGYTVKRHNIGVKDMVQLLNDKNNVIFDVPFEDFYDYAVKEMLTFIDRSINSEIERLIKHFK